MRRLVVIFISLAGFFFALPSASSQIDSLKLVELDGRLEEYFRVLEPESAEIKKQECDFLIGSADDSLLRQRIALKAYEHYLNSPLMGDDAVAVHLIDSWFIPGKVKMKTDVDLMNANVYAMFNRQSLIGMSAPHLEMSGPDGASVKVGGPSSRYSVLFFYDTDCAKCKLETILLRKMLSEKNYPVDFYAIYSGADEQAWKKWREEGFVIDADKMNLVHLWDPEVASDFQMKYGVVQTPRMFLLDRNGTIVGRGLDTGALQQLLEMSLMEKEYEYAGESSMALFDNLFSYYEDLSADDVLKVAGMLRDRTLAKGDTLGFKHLEGDLLYYLTSKRGDAWCEGTLKFVDEYVFSRSDIWNTQGDSLQVVGLAEMMHGLLSRTPVGSRIPKVGIEGWNKLRRKGGCILFHTQGCSLCKAEMAAADSLGQRYLPVNVDELFASDEKLAKTLFDTFDLSALPYIIEVGKRGVVKRKYVTLAE